MAGRKKKTVIEKKHLLIGGGIAFLIGCLLAWYFYAAAPPEVILTDSQIAAARRDLEDSAARMDEIVDRVRKEVTGIRGAVSKEVGSLPADDVARGLNDELNRFRGMEVHPGGMDRD
jgi:hypothetical protein